MRGHAPRFGAAAGALAIALFLAGALIEGGGPAFDAPGEELAAHLRENRTRIQLACVFFAAFAASLVWFLATIASLTRASSDGARRAGTVAFGCGLVFVALFLVDVTTLAVSALRPQNMAAVPQLAVALQDLELLLMGMAAPIGTGLLVACAVLALRHDAIWPRWLGWLAAGAAPLYLLRVGTLFTTDGPFAADGLLGIYVPVASIAGWLVIASVVLAIDPRRAAPRSAGEA